MAATHVAKRRILPLPLAGGGRGEGVAGTGHRKDAARLAAAPKPPAFGQGPLHHPNRQRMGSPSARTPQRFCAMLSACAPGWQTSSASLSASPSAVRPPSSSSRGTATHPEPPPAIAAAEPSSPRAMSAARPAQVAFTPPAPPPAPRPVELPRFTAPPTSSSDPLPNVIYPGHAGPHPTQTRLRCGRHRVLRRLRRHSADRRARRGGMPRAPVSPRNW